MSNEDEILNILPLDYDLGTNWLRGSQRMAQLTQSCYVTDPEASAAHDVQDLRSNAV